MIFSTPSFSANSSIYYIRSDIKTSNGEVIESNLLMTPVHKEFRVKEFKLYKVSGLSYSNSTPDTISAAKHNALTNLLLWKGVKSIKSKSLSIKSDHYEESVLSYEGFVKTPYKVIKQGYNDDKNTYNIDIEVLFSPIVYPQEWSFYYFKKKLYNSLDNMLSIFK